MKQTKKNWPESTFQFEHGEHQSGSHWEPFLDDVEVLLNKLPNMAEEASVQAGYAEFFPAERQIPENWNTGFYFAWPDRNHGLMLSIKIEKEQNNLSSMFPYHQSGMQHRIILDHVIVWENGVEAQIEARLGLGLITFYDSHYLINRAHYETEKTYEFILTAIVYYAKFTDNQKFNITHSDELIQNLNKLNLEYSIAKEMTVNTQGAAMLLPLSKGDEDEYQFSGTITKVEPLKEILGQTGWWVDATLMRDNKNEDKPIDFRMMITQRAWSETSEPCVGKDITGTFWLQGRLWNAK